MQGRQTLPSAMQPGCMRSAKSIRGVFLPSYPGWSCLAVLPRNCIHSLSLSGMYSRRSSKPARGLRRYFREEQTFECSRGAKRLSSSNRLEFYFCYKNDKERITRCWSRQLALSPCFPRRRNLVKWKQDSKSAASRMLAQTYSSPTTLCRLTANLPLSVVGHACALNRWTCAHYQ